MSRRDRGQRVLAIHPMTRGFAFALFESNLSPLDWGTKDIRGRHKNARTLEAARRLIEQAQPEVLVFEEAAGPHSRRGRRLNRLLRLIANHATGQSIEVHSYSRATIRECFKDVGAVTKYEIAQAIAARVAAFGHRLPRLRKDWMSEDVRMGLFDAASLAMTFYCRTKPAAPDLEAAD